MNRIRTEIMQNVFLTYLPAKKFKTGLLSAQFITPLRKETASANALLPAVLNRGTMRCPDMEKLSAAMDRLYGAQIDYTVRKKGERQCVGFVASVIDDSFAPGGERLLESAAELLGEFFLDPVTRSGRFLSEYVDSEKVNLIDALRAVRNDKRDYADLRLMQEMCANEPYGIRRLGDEESVRKLNNRKLYRYGQEMMSTNRLEIFYCGSAERERVTDALLRAFASLHRGVVQELEPMRVLAAPETPRIITESMDVTQGKLSMGWRCQSRDIPAMIMVNLLFGGSSNSKLFLNVREKLSLCYYASSQFARSKGILTVSSGIETKDYDRALEEILRQLEAVKKGEWEDWELTGARSTILSSLRSINDSQAALENWYLGQTATGEIETPEEMARQLAEVTPQRICAAAETIALDTVYFLKGKEE